MNKIGGAPKIWAVRFFGVPFFHDSGFSQSHDQAGRCVYEEAQIESFGSPDINNLQGSYGQGRGFNGGRYLGTLGKLGEPWGLVVSIRNLGLHARLEAPLP